MIFCSFHGVIILDGVLSVLDLVSAHREEQIFRNSLHRSLSR
jgi:hypothetical protein